MTGLAGWDWAVIALYFAGLAAVVSLLTARPPAEKLDGLTYGTTAAAAREETRRSWSAWDVVHSVIIPSIPFQLRWKDKG